jgi:hypothetical protein
MKWFVFCLILFSNLVNADSFTKSNYYIEIDTETNESLQYYAIMGLDKPIKIHNLNTNDFIVLAGQHLIGEESVREDPMCPQGYIPLAFYSNIEYISIHENSIVFFIAYYAKCFYELDVTELEKQSGILTHKE